MIKRKIVLGTAISGLLAIITAVAVTGQLVKSQAPTAATTNVNFTQLIAEKIKGQDFSPVLDADVVYQSPSTVLIEGEKITAFLLDNKYLWQGVDLIKQQGYTIDSVTMTGTGTTDNPDVYHVILSHK